MKYCSSRDNFHIHRQRKTVNAKRKTVNTKRKTQNAKLEFLLHNIILLDMTTADINVFFSHNSKA
jgi:hypothetical protein